MNPTVFTPLANLLGTTRMFHDNDIMPPYTGDIDLGILIALILISLFIIFIVIKNRRGR